MLKLLDRPLQDLPGLVARKSGQSWVYALPVGEPIVFWDDEKMDYVQTNITQPWAEDLVTNTNRAISDWAAETPAGMTPYHPPILREHQLEGWRGGDILETRLAGSQAEKNYGVYLLVDWLPGVWEQIQAGETAHVSIGTLARYVDSKGRDYSPMINELSITETPRLKNIGAIQDTVSLRLSDALTQGVKIMGYEEIMAMLQQIADRLGAVEEGIPALAQQVADIAAMCAEMAVPAVVEAGDGMKKDEDLKMGGDMLEDELLMMDPEREDEVLETILERKVGVELCEKIMRLTRSKSKAAPSIRLNDAPASKPAPASKLNRPEARLQQARSKGLTGLAAIEAAFGK